ncbi:MAG: hypothetical protein ACTSRI_13295 [Promethearchaeota archaeon]
MLNIIWAWQLRCAEDTLEKKLARWVALVSTIALICNWIWGYYGFGSFIALLIAIWLMRK